MPRKFPVNKPNGLLNALLSAAGVEDDALVSTLSDVKDQIFVETSEGKFLDRLGNNYGCVRPSAGTTDVIYRCLIRKIALNPHNRIKAIRDVLECFLGPSTGLNWEVWQINPGEIIIEIELEARDLASATYIRADATVNGNTTFLGDYMRASSVELGSEIDGHIFIVAGNGLRDDIEKVLEGK